MQGQTCLVLLPLPPWPANQAHSVTPDILTSLLFISFVDGHAAGIELLACYLTVSTRHEA